VQQSLSAVTPLAWIHNSSVSAGTRGLVVSTASNDITTIPFEVRSNNSGYNGGSALFTVLGNGNTTIGGTLKVAGIASGVGTKAVRVDPSTGLFTYADTTSGGGGGSYTASKSVLFNRQ